MVPSQQAGYGGECAGKSRKIFLFRPSPPKYSVSICDQVSQCMDFTLHHRTAWAGGDLRAPPAQAAPSAIEPGVGH